MSGPRGLLLAILSLWLAGGCQLALSQRLSLGPGAPDFLIVVVACLGLHCDRRGATWLGFGAGLIHGALPQANVTLYVVSFSGCAFLLGWFNMVAVEANAVLSFLASSILTLGILFSLLFMGIFHGPLLPYVGGTLLTAVFNGVIAIPVYALLKKIVGSPSRLG